MKIKKPSISILFFCTALVLFFAAAIMFLATQSNRYVESDEIRNGFCQQVFVLEKGEKLILNLQELFGEKIGKLGKYTLGAYEKSTVEPTDIVVINKNEITAVKAGGARLSIRLYDKANKKVHSFTLGYVYVLSDDFVPISTAEQLAGISDNLHGNYIITADIDLSGYGQWTPPRGVFDGIIINPGGFKIYNLDIIAHNNSVGLGLFDVVSGLVSGIILENIAISSDVTSCGGICGALYRGGLIENCKVSGKIRGGVYIGGIAGASHGGFIINCSFEGELSGNKEYSSMASGGIVGYCFENTDGIGGGTIGCHVNATISGTKHGGGIIGYAERDYYVSDCVFIGTIDK